jgi:CHAT domain-containing protein
MALQVERYDEALDDFKLSSQLAGMIHADYMQQLDAGNAGWAYFDLGDFEQAIDSFREARSVAEKIGATDSQILWRRSEGLSLSRVGQLKQAQACYEDALRGAQASTNVNEQAAIETSLALLFLRLNQLNIAKNHADTALAISRQVGSPSAGHDASLAEALIATKEKDNPEAEAMLLQILHDADNQPSIRWQSQDALAMLYAAQDHRPLAEKWYREAIRTFETQRNSVQHTENRLPFLANGDELYRHYSDFLITTNRSTEALYLLDGARAKTLKDGLSTGSIAREHLPNHATAVSRDMSVVSLFYSLGSEKSYLWVVKGKDVHLLNIPAEAEIKTRIERYQASILASRDAIHDRNADAIWLYDTMVALAEPIIGSASNVVIVPDGPLNGFNMETLLRNGPQGLHYWIEDVTLTVSTSLHFNRDESSLPNMPRKNQPAARMLLIGNPLLATPEYQQLPHAGDEVDKVGHYFPAEQRTVFTQSKAIPSAYVTANVGQYDYVHFVAHGVASTLRPLDSAIVLSRPSKDVDHFKLYARDIVQNPLHARLVTISACYGSGIRNYDGEGLVGLAWAFLRAGAHQVIAALWEVNDESTPQLMDQMYGEITRGARPEQALRTAKLSLLHSQGVFRKPLYWAAFQVYSGH